jgi:TRAP-type transport system periplasmic protein
VSVRSFNEVNGFARAGRRRLPRRAIDAKLRMSNVIGGVKHPHNHEREKAMNTRNRIGALGAAVIAITALGAAGTAKADGPSIIKLGSTSPAKASQVTHVYKPWIERMEKDSGGTLKIEAFYGGSLVRSHRKQYEGLVNGMQDGATVVTSYTEKLFPDFGLFSLPFMFRGTGCEEAAYAAWNLYERGMIRGLDKVHVVAVFTNDNSGMHFNEAIDSLDDIKGMKIRAAGPGEAGVIEALGAVPVSMSIAQVAESLHRGVIDGTLNGWSALNTFRITPLIKSDLDMPFGVRAFFIAFNKKAFDALPAKAQQAIDKNGGLKLSTTFGKFWADEGAQMRAKLAKEHTVLRPNAQELEAKWEPKFHHIRQAWIDEDKGHRQKLFDDAKKLATEYRDHSS